MNKRWSFKPIPEEDVVKSLSKELNTSPIISKLIAQKGIISFSAAKKFFRPSLNNLHDPFMLKDMGKAVTRITSAIEKKESILVYGDYDVDGTTSVAMMYDFLDKLRSNVKFYIPDRYSEGYGISEQGIRWASNQNIKLIISLDCGIRANKNIQLAKDLGIDVIVCDHHEAGESLPPAHAIINPKQKDCNYPFDGLSGCGVGFKLLQAIAKIKNIESEFIYSYLDLVAISIAADIVPIIDENRILIYHGLKILETNPRKGLEGLKKIVGITSSIAVSKVVFGIAPRINAAGRIGHAKQAVNLLISCDKDSAQDLAEELNYQNAQRKEIDQNITQEAIEIIESKESLINAKTTVLFKENWHKGVLGIVASRCIEKYYRPTVIMTSSNNKATGSVRSVSGYNVYEALCECSDLLERFGGHKYAAGLTLDLNNIEKFKKRFELIVSKTISPELLIPKQEVDLLINLDEINFNMYKVITQMAPFGPGNMNPIFVSENLIVKKYWLLKENHLKMIICQKDKNIEIEAIGFNMAHKEKHISEGKIFKMAYKLEENEYLGNTKLQLHIKDIKAL